MPGSECKLNRATTGCVSINQLVHIYSSFFLKERVNVGIDAGMQVSCNQNISPLLYRFMTDRNSDNPYSRGVQTLAYAILIFMLIVYGALDFKSDSKCKLQDKR